MKCEKFSKPQCSRTKAQKRSSRQFCIKKTHTSSIIALFESNLKALKLKTFLPPTFFFCFRIMHEQKPLSVSFSQILNVVQQTDKQLLSRAALPFISCNIALDQIKKPISSYLFFQSQQPRVPQNRFAQFTASHP